MQKENKSIKNLAEKQNRIAYLEKELTSLRSAVTELKVLNEIAIAAMKVVSTEQMLDLILKKSIKDIRVLL